MKVLLAAVVCSAMLLAQDPPAQTAPPAQVFAPEQLDSMVAPIALYSDSLLSQVLVASTYPLELVEANQWLSQHANLQGTELVTAAQRQNWDPSIQALVPFGDVIKRLTSDIRWTTDLGNAFLAQQADVMNAVQRMRARARSSGKLADTPQQRVVVENQGDQQAIEIQPVDPQVVYVPVYDPNYFWGAPSPYYPWPGLYYPGISVGWGWGFGIHLGFYFGGCCGWGGWGWGPGWFNHSIFVNNFFFHRYNFREFGGGGAFRGSAVWAHDPAHRLGVPYGNRAVAQRFAGSNFRGNAGAPRAENVQRGLQQSERGAEARGNEARGNESRGSEARGNEARGNEARGESGTNNHSAFGGVREGGQARVQSDHGFSSMGPARTAPAFHGGGGGGGGHAGGGGGHGGGGRR